MLPKKVLSVLLTTILCSQLIMPALAVDTVEPTPVTEKFCQAQVVGDIFDETGTHVLLVDTSVGWRGMCNGRMISEYDIFGSVNMDDHLLYPVRAISQYLGFTVDWDETSQTVTLQNKAAREVVFTIGEMTALVDGETQAITTAPAIINDKLMLPIRALMETLGGYVEYDEKGILTLIDDATNFTVAESEALALMQQGFWQSYPYHLSDVVQLAQIDDKTYHRIGRNSFYVEQNGVRSPIDLGKNAQYVLGIDREMIYYITGDTDKEGRFINGHLCRADLTGSGRQVLAEYDDHILRTSPKEYWHHDLPTYFFHGDDYDYIMVYGGTSHHGGYYLYKLQDQQAVIKYYFDAYSKDWLLFNDRLYFICHSMGVPWGLQYIQLNADPVFGEYLSLILKDYRFLQILPLSEDRMLALVECDAIPSPSGYVQPDPAKYAFCLIDTATLSAEILRTSIPPNGNITVIDEKNVYYIDHDGKLCWIVLP